MIAALIDFRKRLTTTPRSAQGCDCWALATGTSFDGEEESTYARVETADEDDHDYAEVKHVAFCICRDDSLPRVTEVTEVTEAV